MLVENTARRNFLKATGTALAGAAVGAAVQTASAKPRTPGTATGGEYDVRAFGAKGDGKTLDMPAINQAISESNGGFRNITISNCARRVTISDVVASNCISKQASLITGIPGHSIEDLRLSNIYILHQGGGTKEDAAIQPPENENAYPEPSRFGVMPAHGFYIRHVKGLEIRNVEVKYMKEDLRPALVLDDVQSAHLVHVKAAHAPGVPNFVLKNVEDFTVHHSKPVADTELEKVAQKQL